ncbi:hypothetical protein ACROYT_G026752 [Oculina patagonica]
MKAISGDKAPEDVHRKRKTRKDASSPLQARKRKEREAHPEIFLLGEFTKKENVLPGEKAEWKKTQTNARNLQARDRDRPTQRKMRDRRGGSSPKRRGTNPPADSQRRKWNWTEEQEDALQEVKRLVTEAPVLSYYDPSSDLAIQWTQVKRGRCSPPRIKSQWRTQVEPTERDKIRPEEKEMLATLRVEKSTSSPWKTVTATVTTTRGILRNPGHQTSREEAQKYDQMKEKGRKQTHRALPIQNTRGSK